MNEGLGELRVSKTLFYNDDRWSERDAERIPSFCPAPEMTEQYD